MFNKNYTLVVDANNSDETFKNLFIVLNSNAHVKKIHDVEGKSGPMTMIDMETTGRKWKQLMTKLNNVGLTMYQVGDYWFI